MTRGNENPFHVSSSDTSGRRVNRSVLSCVQHWIYGVLAAGTMVLGAGASEPPLVELLPIGNEGVRSTSETPTDGDLVLKAIFVDFPDAQQSPPRSHLPILIPCGQNLPVTVSYRVPIGGRALKVK